MEQLLAQYGLTGLAIGFLIAQVWPWIRDKVFPQLAADRKQSVASGRQREDRILDVLDTNNRVMARLEETLRGMGGKLDQVCEEVDEMKQDMAGLYERIQAPRPSRITRRPAMVAKDAGPANG